MTKPGKIFLVTVLLVLVAVASTIISYREKPLVLNAPFTVLQDEILITPEYSLFEAVISNSGSTPLFVKSYGFDSLRCYAVQTDLVVSPGQTVAVTVQCHEGTTAEQIEDATFYVVHSTENDDNYQVSSELGSGLSFVPPSSRGSGGGSGTFEAFIPAGSSGSNTGSGIQPPTGPGVIEPPTSGANLGSGFLQNLLFISVGESTQSNGFFINNPIPRIKALTFDSAYCRWHTTDTSYPNMPSSHQCALDDDGLISCSVNAPLSEGSTYLGVSCADTLAGTSGNYHGSNNNLDLSGRVDYTPPVVDSIFPSDGTSFSSETSTVVTIIHLNEAGDCRAAVRSAPLPSPPTYPNLNIDCAGDGTDRSSCSLNLLENSNYVYIACRDVVSNFPNLGRGNSLIYTLSRQSSFAKPDVVVSRSSGGGSGGSSDSSGSEPATDSVDVPPVNVDKDESTGGTGTEDAIVP